MTVTTSNPPEQGQLDYVRSRYWVVNDITPSTLPPDPLHPTLNGPQNLLTLFSVEDNGLGEELQVVWELEPGKKVVEKVPTKIGGRCATRRWISYQNHRRTGQSIR